ncbi:hypothetical protein ABIE65_004070 [Constrictibacter sp. MBR-5]|uniref:hypothetical protein n=1 Tax=Constrictibacter sp. MBR-5 TaxID=3156467 RepID=UPI0033955CE4
MEFEVDRSESEPKAAYQPPILVDYGLLAKEAAEGGLVAARSMASATREVGVS